MALVAGDILRLIDEQTLFGETVKNVYFYRYIEDLGGTDYADLVDGFDTAVITPCIAVQVDELIHASVHIDNLSNGVDFYDEVTNRTGTITGSTVATNQLAWSIILQRATKATRNGFKRIGGIAEGSLNGNVPESATLTNIQLLADGIASDLQIPDGLSGFKGTFEPIIVGTDPVTKQPDITRTNLISTAIAQNRVTTQNTRKTF